MNSREKNCIGKQVRKLNELTDVVFLIRKNMQEYGEGDRAAKLFEAQLLLEKARELLKEAVE